MQNNHPVELRSIRDAYGEALIELGQTNRNVVVLDADVSSSTKSSLFGVKFPERFYNVGIAEGNMMAMAAGFASCGKIPFVNTFAVFATLRAGDPLRSVVAYPHLNVKIGAGYSGVSDSYDGATHQSVEDISIVRAIPNITVIVVADAAETRLATLAAAAIQGPVYLRLSRAEVPVLFKEGAPFRVGKANVLHQGGDLTIIANGYMVHKALTAVRALEQKGIHARLLEMHTVKPIDCEAIVNAARETGVILTVEEHSVFGGLGSAVAEVISQEHPVPLRILGFNDCFGESGGYDAVLEKLGLSSANIIKEAEKLLRRKI